MRCAGKLVNMLWILALVLLLLGFVLIADLIAGATRAHAQGIETGIEVAGHANPQVDTGHGLKDIEFNMGTVSLIVVVLVIFMAAWGTLKALETKMGGKTEGLEKAMRYLSDEFRAYRDHADEVFARNDMCNERHRAQRAEHP